MTDGWHTFAACGQRLHKLTQPAMLRPMQHTAASARRCYSLHGPIQVWPAAPRLGSRDLLCHRRHARTRALVTGAAGQPDPRPTHEHNTAKVTPSVRPDAPQPVAQQILGWLSSHKAWLAAAIALSMTAVATGVVHAGPAAPPALASATLSDRVMEATIWALGKISQFHVAVKILLVFASTLPCVLAFGALYSAITSTEMKASCIKMYALLNKLPGMQVLNEKTVPAAILVNAAFIAGTFIFAILLGIVTEEVKTTFKNFRNGKYQLNQTGHVVVLNWNQQTVPLLRQIAAARNAGEGGMFKHPVAILAEVPKAEMDSVLKTKLKGLNVDVVTRTGSPSVPGDLASVAAAQAAAIIVMTPDKPGGPTPSSAVAQAAMSLAAASPTLALQHVVFQASQKEASVADNVLAFKRLAHLGNTTQFMDYSDAELITRLTAVSAIQPGMQRIISQLLAKAWLRTQDVPAPLVGCTYQHARRMFADGVLVGVVRGDTPDMLVKETYVIKAEDQLIMVTLPQPGAVPVNEQAEPVFLRAADNVKARLASAPQYKHMPRQIICVLPDTQPLTELVDVYAELCPKNSTVTFLLPKGNSGPSKKGNVSLRYLSPASGSDNVCSAALLREAGVDQCTAVIVAGTETMPTDQADAYVTSVLLQVQDSVTTSGRTDAPHFVAHIRKQATQASVNAFLDLLRKEASTSGSPVSAVITKPDLFHSDDLCGGILAHTAKMPAFSHLVAEVLGSDNAEVYIRNPLMYNLRIGDLITFADVAETARAFGETAIGIIRSDGKLTLAPEPTYPLNLQAGDRVVVIAEDYDMNASKRA